jgi:CarD family transcriptional regulator
MFKKGDYVVYSNNGICRVEDTVTMSMLDGKKEYYTLIPINEPTAKIYLPLDYQGQRVRLAMNEEQARELCGKIGELEEISVVNEKERERVYKEAIASNDPYILAGVLKTISGRKNARELQGKKSTSIDDRYIKIVENQLYGELSHALQVNKEELEHIIRN